MLLKCTSSRHILLFLCFFFFFLEQKLLEILPPFKIRRCPSSSGLGVLGRIRPRVPNRVGPWGHTGCDDVLCRSFKKKKTDPPRKRRACPCSDGDTATLSVRRRYGRYGHCRNPRRARSKSENRSGLAAGARARPLSAAPAGDPRSAIGLPVSISARHYRRPFHRRSFCRVRTVRRRGAA